MKYRLETEYYLYDQLLPAGTEIGDDTNYPIYDGFGPGVAMTPLDKDAENAQKEYAKHKQNWGRPPEESLNITNPGGDGHPFAAVSSINRPEQPIIPAPIEHVTKPNDMKPNERAKEHPIVERALADVNERIAQQNSEREAAESNKLSADRAKAAGSAGEYTGAYNKPGQGPDPKSPTAQGVPGQGPAKSTATGDKPKPPTEPSNQVPRDQADTLTPSSETGKYEDPSKAKK